MKTLRKLAALWLLLSAPLAAFAEARIIVQESPLAGFQYYDGKALWDNMKPDRKSTRLNSSHVSESRMPSSA